MPLGSGPSGRSSGSSSAPRRRRQPRGRRRRGAARRGLGARPVALLTTHDRHPEQKQAVDFGGYAAYWDAFFAEQDVFYGHVLGNKGLERSVVVLAVNGFKDPDRTKEMLYVGLSRARTLLVVVGQRELLSRIGGPDVANRLRSGQRWHP